MAYCGENVASWTGLSPFLNANAKILHAITNHHEDNIKDTNWKLLDEREVVQAKEQERKKMHYWRSDVGCTLCRNPMPRRDIRRHFLFTSGSILSLSLSILMPLYRHAMEAQNPEDCIFIPLDVPMNQPPYAVKIAV